MRAVCVNHSKKLTVPAREREGDAPAFVVCPLPGLHEDRDILVEPGAHEFNTLGEQGYKRKLEQFEMFWQQAI